ncbi:MAG: alpha/beta fold hydrolase [Ignavibacterium sp.]
MIKNKHLISIVLALVVSILSSVSIAQSIQKFSEIGDFVLESRDTIKNCILGYRTFGKPNEDFSNIIIYPTWFGGNSEQIGTLLSKYKFVDTTKYFIIAIDALGNGVSSSPSNYSGDKSVFDKLTIKDMVNSQYKFLTEKLGYKNIYAVIGGSMGSMQAIQWAVSYPDFIKKVIAYVPSPKVTSYDLLWINTQIKLIETLMKYEATGREIKTLSDMMTSLISRTPDYVTENVQLEKFSEYLESFNKEPDKIFTLENYLAQIKAIRDFDFSADFSNDFKKAAEQIKSKLFLIISKRDMMVNPKTAMQLAELTGCRTLFLDNNCGHLAVTCEIEKVKKEIADFLSD